MFSSSSDPELKMQDCLIMITVSGLQMLKGGRGYSTRIYTGLYAK
jgi:hypothetical protein